MTEAQANQRPGPEGSRLARSGRSAWRWVKRGALLALVLAVAYVVWTNHRGDQTWRAAVDAAAQRGIPASVHEWREQRTDRPGEWGNAAGYYEAALAWPAPRNEAFHALPGVGVGDAPAPMATIEPELRNLLDRYAEEQGHFAALLEAARAHDRFDYGIGAHSDASHDMVMFRRMRTAARRLSALGLHAEAQGDAVAAADWIEHTLALNASFDDEPGLTMALVQVSIDALAIDDVERLLSRLEPDAATLRRLGQALGARADAWYSRGLMAVESEIASRLEHGEDPLRVLMYGWMGRRQVQRLFAHLFAGGAIEPPWWEESAIRALQAWGIVCPGWAKRIHARGIHEMLDAQERMRSLGEDWPALARLQDETGGIRSGEAAGVDGAVRTFAVIQARLHTAIAALHVESFRREHGRWPESLADLDIAPPIDPLDGQPMRYRASDTGRIVYSVGSNLRDDGGYGVGETNPDEPHRDNRDQVFRLYDAERRGSELPHEAGRRDRNNDRSDLE